MDTSLSSLNELKATRTLAILAKFNVGVGAFIRKARRNKKLTLKQCAQGSGVGESTWWHVESNEALPSTEILGRIAAVLDMDYDDMLTIYSWQLSHAESIGELTYRNKTSNGTLKKHGKTKTGSKR